MLDKLFVQFPLWVLEKTGSQKGIATINLGDLKTCFLVFTDEAGAIEVNEFIKSKWPSEIFVPVGISSKDSFLANLKGAQKAGAENVIFDFYPKTRVHSRITGIKALIEGIESGEAWESA